MSGSRVKWRFMKNTRSAGLSGQPVSSSRRGVAGALIAQSHSCRFMVGDWDGSRLIERRIGEELPAKKAMPTMLKQIKSNADATMTTDGAAMANNGPDRIKPSDSPANMTTILKDKTFPRLLSGMACINTFRRTRSPSAPPIEATPDPATARGTLCPQPIRRNPAPRMTSHANSQNDLL